LGQRLPTGFLRAESPPRTSDSQGVGRDDDAEQPPVLVVEDMAS